MSNGATGKPAEMDHQPARDASEPKHPYGRWGEAIDASGDVARDGDATRFKHPNE